MQAPPITSNQDENQQYDSPHHIEVKQKFLSIATEVDDLLKQDPSLKTMDQSLFKPLENCQFSLILYLSTKSYDNPQTSFGKDFLQAASASLKKFQNDFHANVTYNNKETQLEMFNGKLVELEEVIGNEIKNCELKCRNNN